MERLIDDLRTMTLSEAGTLPLHREPVDPDVLVDEVVRSFSGAAATAGVTVRAEVPDDLPILDVDPVRVREVLANLVANAIRHTPAGGSVTVSAAGRRIRGSELRVADTGPGIDPEVLPHVFDRFVKTAGSRGSGLGLAIARSLMEAHGGTLDVAVDGEWPAPRSVPGSPSLRSRDPHVVHGRLDRAGGPQVGRLEHDPDLLAGPIVERHGHRGPDRGIGSSDRTQLLLDQRPRPVLALARRPGSSRRPSHSTRG